MDSLTKKIKVIYENSSSILLSAALVYAFCTIWELKIPAVFIIALSILTISAIKLFSSIKNNVFIVVLAVMLLLFGLALCRLLKFDIIHNLKDLLYWTAGFFSGDGKYNALYAYVFICILVIIASIITYCIEKSYIARLVTSIALFAGAIIFSLCKLEMPKFSVCIGIFYILNILIEISGIILNKKITAKNSKNAAIYLMPACIIAAIIAVILPSGPRPIQWTAVKNAASAISNRAEIIFTEINLLFDGSGGDYSINFSGYSEKDKKLGGAVTSSTKTMLDVKLVSRTKADLYLTGSVRNQYTGDSWTYCADSEYYGVDEYMLDFFETLNSFERAGVSKDELNSLIATKQFALEFNGIKTKTLFYPDKTYGIKLSNSNTGLNSAGENILFKRVKGKGMSYEADFADINYESDRFKDIIRSLNDFSYSKNNGFNKDFKKYVENYTDGSIDKYDLNELNSVYEKRAEDIRENYLSLPAELPERVGRLAVDLTRNYDNDYDKLKAIEAYLNTYKYTTVPAKTPDGRDFTDNFLFEQKEGYCTYFASTMAVLGRCIGIPTRYVEGVVVDYENETSDNVYTVTNDKAHAWTECYFEGIGWIPFEPTSGYLSGRFKKWSTSAAGGSPVQGGYDEYDYSQYFPQGIYTLPEGLTAQPVSQKADYSKLIIISAVLLFMIIALSLYYLFAKIRYERKLKKSIGSERMCLIFSEIIYYLKQFGHELRPQDTILNFAEKAGERFCYDDITLMTAAKIFMKVRYAGMEASEEEFNKVIFLKDGIESQLSVKMGKVRKFLLKFSFYSRL